MLRTNHRVVRRRASNDQGEVPVNTVICVAMLGLFFMVVEFGLVYAAQQTARGAARHALDVARVEQGSSDDGEAVAMEFLAKTSVLQDAEVEVTRGAETVTVVVTGDAWSPAPVGVSIRMTAPVERVVG